MLTNFNIISFVCLISIFSFITGYSREKDIAEEILSLKAKDGERNLIESLYGFKFHINNKTQKQIIDNISKQIKTNERSNGTAIDIDNLKFIKDVQLVCTNISDLEIMLQNQLDIYEKGR